MLDTLTLTPSFYQPLRQKEMITGYLSNISQKYAAQSLFPFMYAVSASNPDVIAKVGNNPALYMADDATFDTLHVHNIDSSPLTAEEEVGSHYGEWSRGHLVVFGVQSMKTTSPRSHKHSTTSRKTSFTPTSRVGISASPLVHWNGFCHRTTLLVTQTCLCLPSR